MNTESFKRKLSAILSADIVGYSRLMGEDEELTVRTLSGHREMMATLIKQHQGRVVDSPGDNLLAEFESVTRAVDCAVEIQREMAERNEELPDDRKMEYRIGVNLGDVIAEGDRIYGDGVNIAARLESLAEPGGICISGFVYNQVKNRLKLEYEFMGEQSVKNIKEPVPVYRVLSFPGAAAHRVIKAKETEEKSWRNTVIIAVVTFVVVLGILAFWNLYLRGPAIEPVSIEPEQAPAVGDMEEAPKTIAVLPFDDLSAEKDQEYFVLGLSEEILNYISKIPKLHVTSKQSSFIFKDSDKTMQEIAEILGREYILEGSVRKAGNSLRVTAQLIHVADDRQLWSQTYDRELKDIFKIQEEIANNVADKLKLTLDAFQLLGGTENIEAYELYLIAQGKMDEAIVSEYKNALELLDAAIVLDPEFALAWAHKADIYHRLNVVGPYSRAIAEADAGIRAAQKAIELEANLADGYIYLGYIKAFKGDWFEAEFNCRRALELIGESLSFDDAFIVPFYLVVGNFKRAYELLEKMRRKEPNHQIFLWWYYQFYGLLGDRQQAEEEYRHRNKLLLKGYSYWHDEVITIVRLGSGDVLSRDEIVSSNSISITLKEYLDSPEEGLAELRRIYTNDDNLSYINLVLISIWAAYFGDPEFAMDIIEKHARINATTTSNFWYPIMREIRQLPRFKEFVREIGLVEYWKEYGWPDLCRPVGDDDFVCD